MLNPKLKYITFVKPQGHTIKIHALQKLLKTTKTYQTMCNQRHEALQK